MPLIHSKKPSAFKENIRKEVHAGKPVKQAVAIAYSVKRKAEHKADGGMCMACGGMPCKMADGGPVLPGADSAQDSMRKAFKFAKGGVIKGVHEEVDHGASKAGIHAERAVINREYNNDEADARADKHNEESYELHRKKLAELRGMEKPKLQGLAKGGEVESDPDDEIHGMLGSELMDAIHSKDHKKIMSSLEAIVLSHLNKKED